MFTRVRLLQVCLIACVLSLLSTATVFADNPSNIQFTVVPSVTGGGTSTINAKVYTNPSNHGITTVLAVHGLTETAATWGPLANAIFADNILGLAVKRVIAIDLVGHGVSGNPTSPTLFGNMTINDNVSVVIQSIDALRSRNLGPQVIMGHSMGGLAVQGAQEALLASGSSLAKHGVFGAILVAAVPALGSQWHQPPPSNLSGVLVTTPELGTFLPVLPGFIAQTTGGFTKLDNTIVSNAPTATQLDTNGWVGKEPLTVLLQLTAMTGSLLRPGARQGAFAIRNGTVLTVLGFSQDVLTPFIDQGPLYTYLNGGNGPLFRPIVANDAVHAMYLSNPQGLITALRNGVM